MNITVHDGLNVHEVKNGAEARAMIAEIVEKEKKENKAELDQKKKDGK